MSKFRTDKHQIPNYANVGWRRDGRHFLMASLTFTYYEPGMDEARDAPIELKVPAGFQTDGLTIPPIGRGLLDRFGPMLPVGIAHDWLYARGQWKRRDADRFLRDCGRALGLRAWRVWLYYWAVRAFGWRNWHLARKRP